MYSDVTPRLFPLFNDLTHLDDPLEMYIQLWRNFPKTLDPGYFPFTEIQHQEPPFKGVCQAV